MKLHYSSNIGMVSAFVSAVSVPCKLHYSNVYTAYDVLLKVSVPYEITLLSNLSVSI